MKEDYELEENPNDSKISLKLTSHFEVGQEHDGEIFEFAALE